MTQSDGKSNAPRNPTQAFFDGMATTYDTDLDVLGWDPIDIVRAWPFIVYPKESYLDVGCGTGALLAFFQGAGRQLSAMDLSANMIARARRRKDLARVHFEQASAEETWPFPDASFDKITALAMLEFVEGLDRAFDELARVLRPGGRALVSVEDRIDWEGTDRGPSEQRYEEFPLWRRTLDEIDLCLPPGMTMCRTERLRGYRVMELGFTTAYHVIEIQRMHA